MKRLALVRLLPLPAPVYRTAVATTQARNAFAQSLRAALCRAAYDPWDKAKSHAPH